MSVNDRGAVGIGMVELESKQGPTDADYQLAADNRAELSYKDTFKNILTERYDDEKTWWDAVEDLLKHGGEFLGKVSRSSVFPACAAHRRLAQP